jgi:hypothetical protein
MERDRVDVSASVPWWGKLAIVTLYSVPGTAVAVLRAPLPWLAASVVLATAILATVGWMLTSTPRERLDDG